jgi:hypothetical protein
MRCYFQVVRPVLHILQYQTIHLYRLSSESLVDIKITTFYADKVQRDQQ